MVGEDTVRMSVQELRRVHVIRQAMAQALRQQAASEVLGVREQLTPRILGRFVGPYVDKPRLRRRIRRLLDPARYVIEGIG